MSGRIKASWEMRRAIHAWLAQHPDSTMRDVQAAFHYVSSETIRKVVRRLTRDLDVACVNRKGNIVRYRAITKAIKPLADTIERNHPHAVRGHLVKIGKSNEIDAAIIKARAELKALEKAKRDAAREEMREAARAKREAARKRAKVDKPALIEIAPGHWRYSNANGKPIPNQGGQGALRQPVTINCNYDY